MRAAPLTEGRTRRRLVLFAAAVGALVLLLVVARSWRDLRWGTVGTGDFGSYRVTARLLRQGDSPYDPVALLELQQQLGWPYDDVNRLWNPHWPPILTLPMTLLAFGLATMLWAALQAMTAVSPGAMSRQRRVAPG